MSKAIIERIFARELNKDTTNKLWLADMRKHFGGQYPHKWVITKELLETTFGFNTVYALHAGKTQDEMVTPKSRKLPCTKNRNLLLRLDDGPCTMVLVAWYS